MKAGINLNVDFTPLNMGLIEISRLRLKQYQNSLLIPLLYVLGYFIYFLANFRSYLGEDSFSQLTYPHRARMDSHVFLKGLVKLGGVRCFFYFFHFPIFSYFVPLRQSHVNDYREDLGFWLEVFTASAIWNICIGKLSLSQLHELWLEFLRNDILNSPTWRPPIACRASF